MQDKDQIIRQLNDDLSDLLDKYRISCQQSTKLYLNSNEEKDLYIQLQTEMTKSLILNAFGQFVKQSKSLNAKLN